MDGAALGTLLLGVVRGGDDGKAAEARVPLRARRDFRGLAVWAEIPIVPPSWQDRPARKPYNLFLAALQSVQERPIGADDAISRIVDQDVIRNGVKGTGPFVAGTDQPLHKLPILGRQPQMAGGSLPEGAVVFRVTALMGHPQ